MLLILTAFIFLVVSVLAFRIWSLRASVDDFHAYWETRARQVPEENALWYVALGDSAAVGVGASQPEKGYVGLLAGKLAQTTGRPVHVVNLAKSGARLDDVLDKQLARLNSLKLPSDAVVTIDIGSNDMKSFAPGEFATKFEEILRRLPSQTVVADTPYFGPDSHRHGGKQAKAANEIIIPLVEKYGLKRARVFDYTKNNKSLSYYAADFFHPSDKGYQDWFNAFWEPLK